MSPRTPERQAEREDEDLRALAGLIALCALWACADAAYLPVLSYIRHFLGG